MTRAVAQGIVVALLIAARPGVAPDGPWTCPDASPIKGYLGQTGRVYFLPGTTFYDEASPERCYATEEQARDDGARPAEEPAPAEKNLAHRMPASARVTGGRTVS